MTIYFVHDCAEMVRCSSVFRMSSIFAETSVSRTKKKPWGEIEKSCSHTFGCHNLFSCERQHAVSLFSSTELSFHQDFAHPMAMQCLYSILHLIFLISNLDYFWPRFHWHFLQVTFTFSISYLDFARTGTTEGASGNGGPNFQTLRYPWTKDTGCPIEVVARDGPPFWL